LDPEPVDLELDALVDGRRDVVVVGDELDAVEVVESVAGGDVVGRVLAGLGGADLDRPAVAVQGGENVADPCAAAGVDVGDDDDVPAVQGCGVDLVPVGGAHRVGGGDGAEGLDRVDVLLALDDVDDRSVGDRLSHGRQPVQLRSALGVAGLAEPLVWAAVDDPAVVVPVGGAFPVVVQVDLG
jgi:hypothetical protein